VARAGGQCTELLAVQAPDGPAGARISAAQLVAAVPAQQWIACSAGHGAKGRRRYDWTRIQLAVPATAGMARWLLLRRSRSDGELAFYACYGPAATPLIGLVRVAGTRWAVEEGFEQAKGEVGLDHYEVRKWPGWYRHVTPALLAHAFLALIRAQAASPERAKGDTACAAGSGCCR
jgi:SRSO17 transposase